MVVNFRARGISRGARKLARTSTLKKKKKVEANGICGTVDSTRKIIKHPCFLIGKEVQQIFLILFLIYYIFLGDIQGIAKINVASSYFFCFFIFFFPFNYNKA